MDIIQHSPIWHRVADGICVGKEQKMTREEAISLIKSAQLMLINPTTNEPVSDLYMALYMAISALEQNESAEEWYKLFVKKLDEQEPCEDAISREAAISAIVNADNAQDEIDSIRALPSVTPSRQVIENIKAEIQAIEINGQVDEHTMFIRTGEQIKNMALEIIDKHTKAEMEV